MQHRGKPRVLVVDDVPAFLKETAAALRPHFEVSLCRSPLRAVRLARAGDTDLLLTTLVMRELDGFEVIRRVRGGGTAVPIIMVTGFGDENTAVEALRLGATDYLNKPVQPGELLARVNKALDAGRPRSSPFFAPPVVITRDERMLATLAVCETVAGSDSRVLIMGETGTGKELLAQLIHANSARANHPFVEVNCAAIPANLIESELFGHERGAFTGATGRRSGRFEEAAGGTIFLDEIGELGVAVQSKLLRVLQKGDYRRVGGSKDLRSSARVVAATNRDLFAEVQAGRFRADLYYRLNVVSIEVPPLRSRPGDVSLLADHFCRKFSRQRRDRLKFQPGALERLGNYGWPGNIRELEHLVERLSVLLPGDVVRVEDLPPHIRAGRPQVSMETDGEGAATYKAELLKFEKGYFARLLALAGGNMAAAARAAGMDRSQFFRKIRTLGLHEPRRHHP